MINCFNTTFKAIKVWDKQLRRGYLKVNKKGIKYIGGFTIPNLSMMESFLRKCQLAALIHKLINWLNDNVPSGSHF